ncbi:MAG: ABC transporter substrate-binding protein [bacterium]
MRERFFGSSGVVGVALVLLASLIAISSPEAQGQYPVPREQTVVVETDTNYTVFDKANPFIPGGTQWGSGWHQLANEWDWYINYATGETIYWRTTGWKYSPDHMQITWYTREGVKWNDGEPYTAEDIVFTINMLLEDPGLSGASNVENVASAKAVDKYTTVINFKKPDYRFHHKLRMWGGITVVAKHVWQGKNPREMKNWPPVETGPYKLKGVYPDLRLFVWERRDDYWAKDLFGLFPGPKYGIFRMAPPPDLDLADFVKGQVDATLPHIFTYQMIKSAERQTPYVVAAPFMDAVSQGISSFNCAKYPTSLTEFRWAIQHLVNREKHARVYPMAEKSYPTMWPWPDWKALDKWEFPEIAKKYGPQLTYDPAKAAEILDKLGFKKGADGFRRTPKGEDFTLTLLTRVAPDLGFSHAQDLSDELRKIGIKTNLRAVDPGVFGDLVGIGNYDIAFDVLEIYTSFPNDPWQFLDSYHSKHAKPIGERQLSGDRTRSRLKSPELDAVADKMAVTDPDSPEYMELTKKGLDIWFQNLPSVPAVEKMFVQTFSGQYWTGWPTEKNMYHVPYQWWPEFIFVLFELKPVAMFTPRSGQ